MLAHSRSLGHSSVMKLRNDKARYGWVAIGLHWLVALAVFALFGLFEVPSLTGRQNGLEDSAGLVHYWSTWALVVLAGLHGLAALKHHFIDRDATLKRMLRP